MEKCPICKLQDGKVVIKDTGSFGKRIICPRCNEFTIPFYPEFNQAQPYGPILSAWIRNLNEQGEVPEINPDTLEDLQKHPPNHSPREKQIILLRNIERRTTYPSEAIKIVPKFDFPLAWASNEEEFIYYIKSLTDRGFLRRIDEAKVGLEALGNLTFFVIITADGWDYLEKLERHIEERTQAFVAMSFSEDLKHIWEGPIKNAIEKAGYKPHRVDAQPHNENIDFKMISDIKNSRFIVADFTGQKNGVYFEAGYALGLGLPVIWCVKKDELDKAHFDTRQYNHIAWESPNDLENKLYDFICAIIGKGKGTSG